jgi:Ni,Fe-hydrogenase III component G
MQLALLAIALTASKRLLPEATKDLKAAMSPTQLVLASAETTDLEKASSIDFSLWIKVNRSCYLTSRY